MVRPLLADSPRGPRGQSAASTRKVRSGLCRSPKSFASIVALLYVFELGFVPRVGRSVVGTLGCEFGVVDGVYLY
jgi:hypothetical protein